MTSCENHHFLPPPPSLPSVMVRHYCLDPPPQNKNWRHLGLTPLELFQLFCAYHYNNISVSPSSTISIINAIDLKWISKLLPIIVTQPMTVVSPATLLSIHQVLLAPLQVGANLQIRAPPLHRRQLTKSRIQSDDSFTTYLYSPEYWYLTRCCFSSQHELYHQNHTT